MHCDDDVTRVKTIFVPLGLSSLCRGLLERLIASRICPGWVIAHTSVRTIFQPRLAHCLGCDRGVQVVVASRAVPTPVARVPRAFPTHETPASVSRRFRRDDA